MSVNRSRLYSVNLYQPGNILLKNLKYQKNRKTYCEIIKKIVPDSPLGKNLQENMERKL